MLRIYLECFAPLREIFFLRVRALDRLRSLTLTADADLAANDMSDQGDDDDDERREKGNHGAALELSAEGIIERQQRHRARLAGTQQNDGADIARRRDKTEQPDDDERRRQQRDQDPAVAL